MGRERYWDKCFHCDGNGKCDCGSCRVFLGEGYDNYVKGSCTTCGGEGGTWRYKDDGTKVDEGSSYYRSSSSDERRR